MSVIKLARSREHVATWSGPAVGILFSFTPRGGAGTHRLRPVAF
jgi:hypothetical protein